MKKPLPILARWRATHSFVLVEVMLGVLIFAIGVLAIGQAVNNCLTAESARYDDDRARLALQNKMTEIESGVVQLETSTSEQLSDMFVGITLKTTSSQIEAKNENNQPIAGIYNVTVEATWTQGTQPQSKMISFYALRLGLTK